MNLDPEWLNQASVGQYRTNRSPHTHNNLIKLCSDRFNLKSCLNTIEYRVVLSHKHESLQLDHNTTALKCLGKELVIDIRDAP